MARRGGTSPRGPTPFTAEDVWLPAVTIAVGPSWRDDPTQELTTFESVTVRMNFADGDQIDFSAIGASPEAGEIDELATDVWLFGVVEQRFRVTTVDQTWNEDGADAITVNGLSYKHLLSSRHVSPAGLTFTNVDQGDIVWGMIAHTQARPGGNWRVKRGNVITGKTRDRTYIEGDNLGNLAENLQNVIDGLWWDVDVDLYLDAALLNAFTLQLQPVELGVNARGMQRKSAASTFGNAVYVDGADETTAGVWAESADIATDPRGRWEVVRGFPTTELQTTLNEHALGLLKDVETPLAQWQVELDPRRWVSDSLYLPGDFVALVVPLSTVAPIGTPARIAICQVSEVSVTFSADGALSASMALVETSQVAT